MKTIRKASSISLPVWMNLTIRELAQSHKRSISGEVEFLIEEAIKNNAEFTRFLAPIGTNNPHGLLPESVPVQPLSGEKPGALRR